MKCYDGSRKRCKCDISICCRLSNRCWNRWRCGWLHNLCYNVDNTVFFLNLAVRLSLLRLTRWRMRTYDSFRRIGSGRSILRKRVNRVRVMMQIRGLIKITHYLQGGCIYWPGDGGRTSWPCGGENHSVTDNSRRGWLGVLHHWHPSTTLIVLSMTG
jgi:hypothetical protein